jgi:germination protein M
MNRNKKIFMISALASVTLLSGCSLFGSKQASTQIDPPPVNAQAMMEGMEISPLVKGNYKPTLYFEDADGYVAPLSIPIVYEGVDYAKTALQHLVKGGPVDAMLPEGFTALLPEGTQILGLDVDGTDRTATVDFSKEFLNYQADQERNLLEAITWTLTSFPTIDYVELRVDGKRLTEMPVAHTPIDAPLSKKFGINVELSEGVNYSRATPVTLYFLNQTADDFVYYVPVTRMINLTDDVAAATLSELAKGPSDPNKLDAVLMPGVKASAIMPEGDNVAVEFNDSLVGPEDRVPSESLQAVVLSLTDTLAAKGVQITVQGKQHTMGTDDVDYSAKPVARPVQVNIYEM